MYIPGQLGDGGGLPGGLWCGLLFVELILETGSRYTIALQHLPYSEKCLCERIFANFADRLPFAKILSANILLYNVALCLYIEGKVTHANVFRENSNFKNFAKIFFCKHFTLYGMHVHETNMHRTFAS